MIQTQLVLILLADADVIDLIGSRVHPMRMPQRGSLPAVVYQRVSMTPVNSIAGDSGLDNVRLQVTCWARTYAQAVDLAAKVRSAITSSANLKALTETELDTEDAETRSYGVITDYHIWTTFDSGIIATLARFERVEFEGTGANTTISLPSAIADEGFYLVTKNGLIAQEGVDYDLGVDRDTIVFSSVLAGGDFKDEGIIIYQPEVSADVTARFERVDFEGDGVETEFELPYPVVRNGFYLVTMNGRVVKEGASATYTLHEDRNKIIFNTPPAGGDYKDEGIIIFQKN